MGPLASKQECFKKWCADRKLQARGSGGFASAAADDGIRDVSNVDRMGKDEVELVNEMIKGVTDLINWEKSLEAPSSEMQELVQYGAEMNYTVKLKVLTLDAAQSVISLH